MFYQWSKKVVADRFEEELVVAHLEKGLYYSVRGRNCRIIRCDAI